MQKFSVVRASMRWSNFEKKMFGVLCWRGLKSCLQLLLLLERDSSFGVVQNTMQGYHLSMHKQHQQPLWSL